MVQQPNIAVPTQAAPSTSVPFPPADRPQVVPLLEKVEQLRGNRVMTYHLSDTASIAPDAMRSFYEQLREIGKQDKIDLWIHSHGGHTEVPWRIVQMVREYCSEFGVLVTEVAASAATHISLGADEIVMGPFSVLSPVDPQRQHPLLPTQKNPISGKEQPLPISVQDLKHAVEFIKREAGEEGLRGDPYAKVITALFEKVHPLAIGAIEQSYALSKLITKRMLSTHMDEEGQADEIDKLADALCDDYKSHQFPIARREAKNLGLKVTDASDDLYEAMWGLLSYYDEIDRTPQPLPQGAQTLGGASAGQVVFNLIGHIDTTARRVDCVGFSRLGQDGVMETVGSQWLTISGP